MSRPAETAASTALPTFFEDAAHEHVEAVEHTLERSCDLRFADSSIRLRFAGDELADALLPPFRPRLLRSAAVTGELDSTAALDLTAAFGAGTAPDASTVPDTTAVPDAMIALWQERDVPGGALPIPWREGDLAARGLLRGPAGSELVAVHELGYHAITLIDRRAGLLLHRVPDVASLPWWERAAPLRPALFWALSGRDRHLVHAGAVGDERGGVLLAGAGGSGKTTVALAALAAGMSYVADDYLLLHTAPEPVAWNLFGTAKLDAGHLARIPRFASAASISPNPVADEKWVLDVAGMYPDALAASLPIRAIVVPRIHGGRSALRPASAGVALLALAPSTAFQMPYDDGAVLASLAAVARSVPAFLLEVGDDVQELVGAIDEVLDTAVSGSAVR